jgi:hypothetical protein
VDQEELIMKLQQQLLTAQQDLAAAESHFRQELLAKNELIISLQDRLDTINQRPCEEATPSKSDYSQL